MVSLKVLYFMEVLAHFVEVLAGYLCWDIKEKNNNV